MAGNYWGRVLAGAWDKTWKPLDWNRKKFGVALLAVGTIIVAGLHFGLAAMITSAAGALWIAAPAAFAATILFAWGVVETQAKLYKELDQWSGDQIGTRDAKLAKYAERKPNYIAV